MTRRCDHRIQIPHTNGMAETYCTLPEGHEGDHEKVITLESVIHRPLTCPSLASDGSRCGLPSGHAGNHQNGIRTKSWPNVK